MYTEQVGKRVSKAKEHLMCWWWIRQKALMKAFRSSVRDESNTYSSFVAITLLCFIVGSAVYCSYLAEVG